jgi:hypothetical protein
MSRAAKLTLLGSSLFAASTIVFVHYAQNAEKAVCAALSQYQLHATQYLQSVGNARGGRPGYGAAANKERATTRL